MNEASPISKPPDQIHTLGDLERSVAAMKASIEESRQRILILEKLIQQSEAMIASKRATNS